MVRRDAPYNIALPRSWLTAPLPCTDST
jgi:hypothetical protein